MYLPRDGHLNLGLATVNISSVLIDIEKVVCKQYCFSGEFAGLVAVDKNLGKSLHSEEIRIESVLNEEVTTPVSLADYLAGDRIGIFKVTARDSQRRWRYTTQGLWLPTLALWQRDC